MQCGCILLFNGVCLQATATLTADTYVMALRPDFVAGAQSLEVVAKLADGRQQSLLLVRDIIPEWPTPYILKQPVLLPRNAELTLTAYYANTDAAPQPASVKLTVIRYEGGATSSLH